MNRIKMELFNYGRDKTWTIGLYFGELDRNPVIVMQVLPEGAQNIQGCMEGIVTKVRDKYFPKKSISTLRWFEYWPVRYFPSAPVEMFEVTFPYENKGDIGTPSWCSARADDKTFVLEEVVEPIQI